MTDNWSTDEDKQLELAIQLHKENLKQVKKMLNNKKTVQQIKTRARQLEFIAPETPLKASTATTQQQPPKTTPVAQKIVTKPSNSRIQSIVGELTQEKEIKKTLVTPRPILNVRSRVSRIQRNNPTDDHSMKVNSMSPSRKAAVNLRKVSAFKSSGLSNDDSKFVNSLVKGKKSVAQIRETLLNKVQGRPVDEDADDDEEKEPVIVVAKTVNKKKTGTTKESSPSLSASVFKKPPPASRRKSTRRAVTKSPTKSVSPPKEYSIAAASKLGKRTREESFMEEQSTAITVAPNKRTIATAKRLKTTTSRFVVAEESITAKTPVVKNSLKWSEANLTPAAKMLVKKAATPMKNATPVKNATPMKIASPVKVDEEMMIIDTKSDDGVVEEAKHEEIECGKPGWLTSVWNRLMGVSEM